MIGILAKENFMASVRKDPVFKQAQSIGRPDSRSTQPTNAPEGVANMKQLTIPLQIKPHQFAVPSDFNKRESSSSKPEDNSNKFSNYASIGVVSDPLNSQSEIDSKPSDISLKFDQQIRTRGRVKME
jgi:hypothetical protein